MANFCIGSIGAVIFGMMALNISEEVLYSFKFSTISAELMIALWPFQLLALLGVLLFALQLALSAVLAYKDSHDGTK